MVSIGSTLSVLIVQKLAIQLDKTAVQHATAFRVTFGLEKSATGSSVQILIIQPIMHRQRLVTALLALYGILQAKIALSIVLRLRALTARLVCKLVAAVHQTKFGLMVAALWQLTVLLIRSLLALLIT